MAWTTDQPPLSYGIVVALKAAASNGKSLIVGGSYSPCTRLAYNANPFFDCRARPVSWVSRDGRTWKASGPWTGRLGPRGKAGSDFVALWGVPSGGWDAAQLFSGSDESDDLEPTGPAIWHSDDGRTWTVRNARDAFRDWPCWVDTEASWHFAADQSGRRLAPSPATATMGQTRWPRLPHHWTVAPGRGSQGSSRRPAVGSVASWARRGTTLGRRWRRAVRRNGMVVTGSGELDGHPVTGSDGRVAGSCLDARSSGRHVRCRGSRR